MFIPSNVITHHVFTVRTSVSLDMPRGLADPCGAMGMVHTVLYPKYVSY